MQFKKWITKIGALLFILSSLLLPSWSLDVNSATAQAPAGTASFSHHNSYVPPTSSLKISWEVDVNFIGSQIHAEWIVRATEGNPEAPQVIEEYVYILPCSLHGNVQIQNNKAHFDPSTQDHITCDLPNYREVVKELFNITLNPVCDCIEPWLAAKVHVQPTGQSEYPILYLDEMGPEYLVAEIKHKNGNRAALKTYMSRWSRPQWSKKFKLHKPQTLWSGENPPGFIHTLQQRDAQYPNPWIGFWESKSSMLGSGSQSLEAYTNASPNPGSKWHSWARSVSGRSKKAEDTQMSTEQMTLYIGFNPTSGQYFSGTMKNVGIDPSCIGHG